jgi:hypothetical protein
MTAKNLIEFLQTVPPDMPVFIPGYEGGADSLDTAAVISFIDEGEEHPDYFGRYEPSEHGPIKAVYLRS